MSDLKFTVKDSVFTYLFRQPKYTLELYRTLHPEDQEATQDDCKILTLENILTTGMYNDLGFQVRDRLLVLSEAQSSFSCNISLRMLLYLAETYKEFVEEHKLDLYASKVVSIPRPELYMIYTGNKKDIPDVLHLSDLYEGVGDAEVKIKVLQRTGANDIIDQYVHFCNIMDEQRKRHGYTSQAAKEAIRICVENNILAAFLESRQKEVYDIMVTLFDQTKAMEIHDYNIKQEGIEKGIREIISLMKSMSMDQSKAIHQLMERFELSETEAQNKIKAYWS